MILEVHLGYRVWIGKRVLLTWVIFIWMFMFGELTWIVLRFYVCVLGFERTGVRFIFERCLTYGVCVIYYYTYIFLFILYSSFPVLSFSSLLYSSSIYFPPLPIVRSISHSFPSSSILFSSIPFSFPSLFFFLLIIYFFLYNPPTIILYVSVFTYTHLYSGGIGNIGMRF